MTGSVPGLTGKMYLCHFFVVRPRPRTRDATLVEPRALPGLVTADEVREPTRIAHLRGGEVG
jgi:hypothetical protein